MNKAQRSLAITTIGLSFVSGTLFMASGCSQFVNPFKDELQNYPEVTTASVEGIRGADAKRYEPRRNYGTMIAESPLVAVTHGPLLFEDPSEETGSEDGKFAWTGEDYLRVVTWRARFLLNTLAVPVSLIVTPPWSYQASDGVMGPNWFGELHDAKTVRLDKNEDLVIDEKSPCCQHELHESSESG